MNGDNDLTKWKTLEHEYRQGLVRISAAPVPSELGFADYIPDTSRISSLLSRDVIAKSFYSLVINQTSYYPTDREESDVTVKNKDGSISYQAEMRNRSFEEIDASARAYANTGPIFGLGRFTRIDEKSKKHFESTVRYLQSRNVTVILFLPPYHPIVYETMTNDPQYANVKEVESYLKRFASRENITIVGSYNPNVSNLTSSDFIDGSHPRREAIDQLFSRAAGASLKGIAE